jgi:hypothetical protein
MSHTVMGGKCRICDGSGWVMPGCDSRCVGDHHEHERALVARPCVCPARYRRTEEGRRTLEIFHALGLGRESQRGRGSE